MRRLWCLVTSVRCSLLRLPPLERLPRPRETVCQMRRNSGLRLGEKRAQHSRQRASSSRAKNRREAVACTRQMLAEAAGGGARA